MNTTEKIEQELAAVGDLGKTEELLEGGWPPPLLSVSKHIHVGERSETIRVEVQDGGWGKTTGDLAVLGDALVQALTGEKRHPEQTSYNITFGAAPLSEEMMSVLQKSADVMFGGGCSEPVLTVEQLSEQLKLAQDSASDCSGKHEKWIAYLRDLIVQARKDKRAADDADGGPACVKCGATGVFLTDADSVGVTDVDPNAIVCTDQGACVQRAGGRSGGEGVMRYLIAHAGKDKRAADGGGEAVKLNVSAGRVGDLQEVVTPAGLPAFVNLETGATLPFVLGGRSGYVVVHPAPDLPEGEPVPATLHMNDGAPLVAAFGSLADRARAALQAEKDGVPLRKRLVGIWGFESEAADQMVAEWAVEQIEAVTRRLGEIVGALTPAAPVQDGGTN